MSPESASASLPTYAALPEVPEGKVGLVADKGTAQMPIQYNSGVLIYRPSPAVADAFPPTAGVSHRRTARPCLVTHRSRPSDKLPR